MFLRGLLTALCFSPGRETSDNKENQVRRGVYLPPPTIAYANITAGAKPKPYDEIRKHCLLPPGRGTEGVGFCNTDITAGVKPQPYEKTDSEGLVPLSNYTRNRDANC